MITNTTKKTQLAEFVTFCTNIFTQGKGLMFSSQLMDRGYVFIFKKEVLMAVTMLFVFFPIDIIWLNEEKRIVELKENVKPFTPSVVPKHKSKYFIELPAGTIKETGTEINDKIEWKRVT